MKLSLNAGAQEFGVSRDTLRRRLSERGLQTGPGRTYSILHIHEALSSVGDLAAAKYRREVAEAELAEIEVAKARRTTVDMAEVKDLISRILQPFRARLLAAPAVLGQAANPSDPVHGSKEVGRWIDSVLPLLRQDTVDAFAKGDLLDDDEEEAKE